MTVRGDDLAIATHGRSFWALDAIEPLRHAADAAGPHWIGTDDGLVQITDDGGTTWRNPILVP